MYDFNNFPSRHIKALATVFLATILQGCAVQTYPSPEVSTRPHINKADLIKSKTSQLMNDIDFALNEELMKKQIELERTSIDSIKITFSSNGIFSSGSSKLSKTMKESIDKLAVALKSSPDKVIQVNGHTDSTGSEAYNQKLSEKRAESVNYYMASIGIEPGIINSMGLGESSPRANNNNKQGRALNRRIEITIQVIPAQYKEPVKLI